MEVLTSRKDDWIHAIPDLASQGVNGRPSNIQHTPRPDTIWPELKVEGEVVSDIGPKDTFDESAQVSSPREDDIHGGPDDGRVVGRVGVQMERVESEVVLIW